MFRVLFVLFSSVVLIFPFVLNGVSSDVRSFGGQQDTEVVNDDGFTSEWEDGSAIDDRFSSQWDEGDESETGEPSEAHEGSDSNQNPGEPGTPNDFEL